MWSGEVSVVLPGDAACRFAMAMATTCPPHLPAQVALGVVWAKRGMEQQQQRSFSFV